MKRTIRIVAFFGLSIFLTCCNRATQTTHDPAPYHDTTLVKSDVNRDTAPQVSDADLAAAAAGDTEFALKAFPLLQSDSNTNTVFSPYSITLAAAMLATGATGTTLSEIETAMSFTLPQDRLNPAFNKLDLFLASETTGTSYPSPQLNVVNAIWAQEGFPILPSFLDSLAMNFGAGVHVVDYVSAAEDARQTINGWVARQTNNRIPELMPDGSINDLTRLVLTNAIWFKADWDSKFLPEATANHTFYNRSGTQAQVPFMSQTFFVPAVKNSDYQAVDIPYVGGNLSLLVVMPTAGTFGSFVVGFTPEKLSDVIGQLSGQETALSLPKFTFSTSVDLKPLLKSLGMSAAFDPAKADFSGIDGNRDLVIQSAVHKAFIAVDEKGTEAAAATGFGAGATGMPPQFIVTIDHPFIFAVRDRQTGLILFMGKVVTL